MEAEIFLWTPFETTSRWAAPLVSTTTPSVWTPRYDFTPSWQAVQPAPVCEWGCTQWNTVSALTAVGQALEAALQALLAFVEREVTALLTDALSPIINGIDSYVSNVNQTFGIAYDTVSGGGSVSQSEVSAIFMALSGSVFEVGLGIGAVVEIALMLLTPVDIGPEFIITTLITIVVGTALQKASTSGLFADLGSVTGFDTIAIEAVKSYTDGTRRVGGSPCGLPPPPEPDLQFSRIRLARPLQNS